MKLKIKGKKINLRGLKKSDALSLYQNAKDKEIIRYTRLPKPYKLKHAQEFIEKTHKDLKKKTAYELGIEYKKTDKIIGMMSLIKIDYNNKNAEVGYWLGKKYWGQHISTEALNLIVKFGFKKLKLVRIYANVMNPNISSIKLLERCGFKYEGHLKKYYFRNNRWYNGLMYAITR